MKQFDFENVPIVEIVNEIIIDAVNMNASDIHFDPNENYLKIRIRVDGELRDYSIVENKYKRNFRWKPYNFTRRWKSFTKFRWRTFR